MTYTKTQYVDGVTPLNAKNFNKNEGALEQVSKDIDALSSAITQVDSKVDGKANSNHTHSEYATTSALNNKVDKVSGKGLSTNDFTTVEKNKLASLQNTDVTKTYVDTELGKKSDKTNTYTKSEVDNKIAEAQLGGDGGNIDLSGYATKDDLLTKAEKVHAHTEYASKSSEHTHDNKTALDKITDAKMNSWDSKATGNHNHNSTYSPLGHRHDASEIDNLPSGGGSSTPVIDDLTSTSTTSALSANQGKVLKDEITVLNTKVDNHIANHPGGEGGSFEIITPNGRNVKVKALNDGTLETELPVIPTSELPSDFPKFTVSGESPYNANFLITPHTSNYNFGYVFVTNRKGEVLWYKKAEKGYCYGFKKYKNLKNQNRYTYMEVITGQEPTVGNVAFYENCELVVLNENFEEVDRVRHKKYGDIPHDYPQESHDYIYIDDGHYILLSYYKIVGGTYYENSIQEIKMGKVVWHWQTRDYPELLAASNNSLTNGDYAHINSIQIDFDDNFLVSFRNIGIVKVNKSTKEVMWIIGRNRNDFKNIMPSQIPFQQHDIQFAGDGSFTVFDNFGHTSKSRVCRYFLDEPTMTCLAYKEYITTRNRSDYMGSATVVDDANDVLDIAYGSGWSDIAFEEYDFKNNKQLMLFKFNDGHDMYRVFRDLDFVNSSKLVIQEPGDIAVTGIALPSEETVGVNATVTLTPTIIPSNATNKNVTWSSSDANIATVNGSGVVTGKAEGSATITATTQDGNKTASCNITVSSQVVNTPTEVQSYAFITANGSEDIAIVNWTAWSSQSEFMAFEFSIGSGTDYPNVTIPYGSAMISNKGLPYVAQQTLVNNPQEGISTTIYNNKRLIIVAIKTSDVGESTVESVKSFLSSNNIKIHLYPTSITIDDSTINEVTEITKGSIDQSTGIIGSGNDNITNKIPIAEIDHLFIKRASWIRVFFYDSSDKLLEKLDPGVSYQIQLFTNPVKGCSYCRVQYNQAEGSGLVAVRIKF